MQGGHPDRCLFLFSELYGCDSEILEELFQGDSEEHLRVLVWGDFSDVNRVIMRGRGARF